MLDDLYDRIWETNKERLFERRVAWPSSWKSKAFDLMHAADRLFDLYHAASMRTLKRFADEIASGGAVESRVLEGEELADAHDSQLRYTYLMLAGFALENLLKGILMATHPEYFKTNAKMVDIRSHDLVSLCKRCGISLEPDEWELLRVLTEYAEWMGRYPSALTIEHMSPFKRADGTRREPGLAFDGFRTREHVHAVYVKIWTELDRVSKPVTG